MTLFNINQILPLLEQGAIFQTTITPLTRVWLKEGFIHLHHEHFHGVISMDDFLQTYQTYKFQLVEDEVELFDPLKDQEFYTWKQ
jgi:hypothetical protein